MKKYILLSIMLIICSQSYAAWTEQSRTVSDSGVTMDDVVNRIRQIIDDPYTNYGTVRYSSATLYGLVNQANQVFCLQTRALETSATNQLALGTTEYALPSDCMYLERVTMAVSTYTIVTGQSQHEYLPQKTVWGLDIDNKEWDIESSTPTAFYLRNRYIGFYPAPTYTGIEVQIWYIKYPAKITTGSDYVLDGYTQLIPFWELLAQYASAKIALQEGNTVLYTTIATEYAGGIKEAMSMLKYNPLYNSPDNVMGTK
jgi:hypothetical protein